MRFPVRISRRSVPAISSTAAQPGARALPAGARRSRALALALAFAAAIVGCIVAGTLWSGLPGPGLAVAAVPGVAAPARGLPQYAAERTLGVASCANSLCHGSAEAWPGSNVLQTEFHVWQRSDRHARAYRTLLSDKSQAIVKRMGLTEPAHRAAVCLDCHAHNAPAARRAPEFSITEGVTCESCHGPAERWLRRHVESGASHRDNIAHGLYPTSNDIDRARLCVSCHFGNAQKLVTHRIMAAGHPRMSFELDTFTLLGPAHFRIDADWRERKGTWDGVRAWAIGQAVASQEQLAIFLHPQRGRDGLFPELVLFDCHACHQSMRGNRYLAARLKAGPGIVRLNDSNLLMLRLVARRVDADAGAALAQHIDRLHQAIAGAGEPIAQARAVYEAIDGLLPRIAAHRFAAADLQAMMEALVADGLASQYTDYAGAEQAVFALQSLGDFLARQKAVAPDQLGPGLRRLLALVADDEKYQPVAFQAGLREFAATLQAARRGGAK